MVLATRLMFLKNCERSNGKPTVDVEVSSKRTMGPACAPDESAMFEVKPA